MARPTQEIARDAWRSYLDELSSTLGTVEATVEVDGEDLGAQIVAERLVLTGITYDDGDDVVVIGLDAPGGQPEELEHLIEHPHRIYVVGGDAPQPVVAIDIHDGEERQHIVRLERPPALPEG